jgi:hypothetical protein
LRILPRIAADFEEWRPGGGKMRANSYLALFLRQIVSPESRSRAGACGAAAFAL